MKLRHRLLLVFVLLIGGGSYYLVDSYARDLRPRYLEAIEEVMIDAANVMAEWAGQGWEDGVFPQKEFRQAFDRLYSRQLDASIFSLRKTRVDLRAYITDSLGQVVFDSDSGKSEGKDFSHWRDVYLTLKGRYGARSSLRDSADLGSSELYVAAPIYVHQNVVGVVTVCKPKTSLDLFLEVARRKAKWAGIWAALTTALAGFVLIVWITEPLKALMQYALAIRDGKRAKPPRRLRGEMKDLFDAYEQMRQALEGKQYAEHYVQALTHALKSPLTAMQGTAELLKENPPEEVRMRFLTNLVSESARMRETVDRLLSLAQLENRRGLENPHAVDMAELARVVAHGLLPQASEKQVDIEVTVTGAMTAEAQAQPGAAGDADDSDLEDGAAGQGGLGRSGREMSGSGEKQGEVAGDVMFELSDATERREEREGRPSVRVRGDDLLLRTALQNLCENAVDFSPRGGKVRIKFRVLPEANRLECRVEDEGPGLPDYALSRMGERFFSLPRPDTGRKGTGLGVSWVKEVARLHDGEIRFENLSEGLAVIWSLRI